MKTAMLSNTFLFCGLLWAGLSLAATPINETRELNADAHVKVENLAGLVTVTGWDRNTLELTGQLSDDARELIIEGDAEDLTIRVEYPDEVNDAEETRLTLKVPVGVALDVETVSADIEASNLTGALSLQSVSGDINAQVNASEFTAQTVSGDTNFQGSAPEVELATVSGDIEGQLTGAQEVSVQTVSGDALITVESEVQSFEMETVSGEVSANLVPAPGASIAAGSLSGEIGLTLPADLSATIRAETFSGEIASDFGQVTDDGQSLNVTVGEGDAHIELETFSGEIEVVKP